MTTGTDGLKIGELAHASGLSIRAVRYYDQIGLLTPSRRSASGHRLYTDHDVQRLYRICLLRRTGLRLAEIAGALDDPNWDMTHTIVAHRQLLDRQLAVGQALRRRLERMAERLAHADAPGTTEFLDTLEEMSMFDDALQERISVLVYDDIPAMHDYLVRVFGLGQGRLERDGAGTCVHGEVRVGDETIWLHPPSTRFGLASPRSLGGANGITAVLVDDVDAHHARAVDAGAEITYPPTDQPYGYREYSARDPEGGLWSFMKPQQS